MKKYENDCPQYLICMNVAAKLDMEVGCDHDCVPQKIPHATRERFNGERINRRTPPIAEVAEAIKAGWRYREIIKAYRVSTDTIFRIKKTIDKAEIRKPDESDSRLKEIAEKSNRWAQENLGASNG